MSRQCQKLLSVSAKSKLLVLCLLILHSSYTFVSGCTHVCLSYLSCAHTKHKAGADNIIWHQGNQLRDNDSIPQSGPRMSPLPRGCQSHNTTHMPGARISEISTKYWGITIFMMLLCEIYLCRYENIMSSPLLPRRYSMCFPSRGLNQRVGALAWLVATSGGSLAWLDSFQHFK